MKKFIILCLFAGFTVSAAAASPDKKKTGVIKEDAKSLIYVNSNGQKFKLTKNPKRTIIGFTSFVSLWYYAGGTAVGIPTSRKGAGNVPEAALKVPRIGSFSNLNMEKIIALKPDLVILYANVGGHRMAQEILKTNKTETVLLNYRNYDDFLRILNLFTKLNDKRDQRKMLASPVVSEISKITAKTKKLKGPRFISFMFSGGGLSVETNKANTAHMATMLGGKNIVSAANLPENVSRTSFSLEKIMMENPDVILITTMGNAKKLSAEMKKTLKKDPVWASMDAVKAGRVYFLPNNLFLYRANEKYPESFKMLAKAMYPREKWD